jgi:hypothetical protein
VLRHPSNFRTLIVFGNCVISSTSGFTYYTYRASGGILIPSA